MPALVCSSYTDVSKPNVIDIKTLAIVYEQPQIAVARCLVLVRVVGRIEIELGDADQAVTSTAFLEKHQFEPAVLSGAFKKGQGIQWHLAVRKSVKPYWIAVFIEIRDKALTNPSRIVAQDQTQL